MRTIFKHNSSGTIWKPSKFYIYTLVKILPNYVKRFLTFDPQHQMAEHAHSKVAYKPTILQLSIFNRPLLIFTSWFVDSFRLATNWPVLYCQIAMKKFLKPRSTNVNANNY